jgi:hypothetical protein
MFSEMENVHGEMERVREGFTLVNSDFQWVGNSKILARVVFAERI